MIQMTASLVTALFGSSSTTTSTPDAVTALATFRRANAAGAEEKGLAQEKKDPVTIRALDQFNAALDKAKDINTALSDPRVLAVLAPALGLADELDSPALIRKALLSDPNDEDGLAANLGTTWQNAAATLNLASGGLATLKDSATRDLLSNAYLTYQYRIGLDEQGAGVSDALYFQDKASSITDVYTILGDSVLRRVVTGALGLPDEIAIQSVETQARAVTSRLHLDKLQKPAEVQKLISRYLMSQAGTGTSGSTILSLFA